MFPLQKAWKSFVKDLESLQKKLKKKDAAASLAILENSKVSLDTYLAEVQLQPVAELK